MAGELRIPLDGRPPRTRPRCRRTLHRWSTRRWFPAWTGCHRPKPSGRCYPTGSRHLVRENESDWRDCNIWKLFRQNRLFNFHLNYIATINYDFEWPALNWSYKIVSLHEAELIWLCLTQIWHIMYLPYHVNVPFPRSIMVWKTAS